MMIVSSIHWLIIIFPVIFPRHLITRTQAPAQHLALPSRNGAQARSWNRLDWVEVKLSTGAYGHGLIITLFGLAIVDIINIKNDWRKLYHIWSYMDLYN